MQLLTWLSTHLSRCLQWLAGLMLAAIGIINNSNVFGRYVLSSPINWAEEAMQFLLIGAVFMALVKVTWDGAHIRMDMLLQVLPDGARRVMEFVCDLVMVAVCLGVAWVGLPLVVRLIDYDQRSVAAEIPMALPHSMVTLGFVFTALVLLVRMLSGTRHVAVDDEAGLDASTVGEASNKDKSTH